VSANPFQKEKEEEVSANKIRKENLKYHDMVAKEGESSDTDAVGSLCELCRLRAR
jgi:hypothetical protein